MRNFTGTIPTRATRASAGYDLRAAETMLIHPGEVVLVPTDTTAHMPDNEFLAVYPRSSLSIKRGLMLANGVAVIDADFKRPIQIPLYNFGTTAQEICKGERVAQGIFQRYYTVDNDNATGVRTGGFGSTGK